MSKSSNIIFFLTLSLSIVIVMSIDSIYDSEFNFLAILLNGFWQQ